MNITLETKVRVAEPILSNQNAAQFKSLCDDVTMHTPVYNPHDMYVETT